MKNNYLKVVTDDTLRETRNHGQTTFPFQYYPENLWDFDFHTVDWHWHKELEFMYVQYGEAQCYIGNEHFALPAGYGLFINTKIIHQFVAKQPTLNPNIVFSPTLIAPAEGLIYQQYVEPLLASSLPFVIFDPNVPWHKEIISLLNQIFELHEQPKVNELSTLRLLVSMWDILFKNIPISSKQESISQNSSNAARLQMMMSFIHNHYKEPIRLDDIANFVHLSKNSCMQIFKQGIHQSPVSYLIHYRLKSAAQLLSSTELKIITIAENCGFQDAPYFCRKFKELYGCSPAEYRKRYR